VRRTEDEENHEGTDDAGIIKVTVDRLGAVADVVVAPNWREKAHPRDLGHALATAANAALMTRPAAEPEPEMTPVVRGDARDAYGDPSGQVAQDLLNEFAALFAVFERDLEIYRKDLREAANATATTRSGKGTVEVTMTHGRVTRVTVNPGWAKSARNDAIRVEALAAFTAAERQLEHLAPNTVPLPASITRLRELTSDPHALSKQLGLS
jgi:DNA-binding protein YbaB